MVQSEEMLETLKRVVAVLRDADVPCALGGGMALWAFGSSATDHDIEGIHAFLGSNQLGEAVDRAGADLAVHGHAHAGSRRGATEGGVPTFNVARPVLGAPYTIITVDPATCGRRRDEAALLP